MPCIFSTHLRPGLTYWGANVEKVAPMGDSVGKVFLKYKIMTTGGRKVLRGTGPEMPTREADMATRRFPDTPRGCELEGVGTGEEF